jgi:hypothetical protein
MKPKKTAAELEKIIRQAARDIGPWPKNMAILIYPLDDTWRIMVSYSDASQKPFRDSLLDLSVQLSELYDLGAAASRG